MWTKFTDKNGITHSTAILQCSDSLDKIKALFGKPIYSSKKDPYCECFEKSHCFSLGNLGNLCDLGTLVSFGFYLFLAHLAFFGILVLTILAFFGCFSWVFLVFLGYFWVFWPSLVFFFRQIWLHWPPWGFALIGCSLLHFGFFDLLLLFFCISVFWPVCISAF